MFHDVPLTHLLQPHWEFHPRPGSFAEFVAQHVEKFLILSHHA